MRATQWTGCYKDGWKGLIVSDAKTDAGQLALFQRGEDYTAYEHPAKVSRSLIKRIYTNLAQHYHLLPGATILDPFAGVGLHGLDCLFAGYHFLGMELEPKFVTLAQKNIAYWQNKFGAQPGTAQVLQGDSRYLQQAVAEAGCLVSSPPYANGCAHTGGIDHHPEHLEGGKQAIGLGYQAVISSPPYAGNEKCDYRITDTYGLDRDERRGKRQGKGSFRGSETYGQTPGQLGALTSGVLSAVVSSPPYEAQASNCATNHGKRGRPQWKAGGIAAREPHLVPGYGEMLGQLGNESHATFWSESNKVMAEVATILPAGALAVWIVKAFVRAGKVVDFPGEWQHLCEHHGFTLEERIEASLVEHHGTQPVLSGGEDHVRTERKSFFRRLSEKRPGAPQINHEIVLTMRKD